MRLHRDFGVALRALRLPPRVARFYLRAHRLARRSGDGFSLLASIRPEDLTQLVRLSAHRRQVVELGTGVGWAAIALALAEPERRVISYDPVKHESRERYLQLVGAETRARIELRPERAELGPRNGDPPVELLFIDIGGHSRADTTQAFTAWRDALAPNAVVAFHDYGQAFPGVAMAVAQLGLEGSVYGRSLFACRAGQD